MTNKDRKVGVRGEEGVRIRKSWEGMLESNEGIAKREEEKQKGDAKERRLAGVHWHLKHLQREVGYILTPNKMKVQEISFEHSDSLSVKRKEHIYAEYQVSNGMKKNTMCSPGLKYPCTQCSLQAQVQKG